MTGPFPGKHHEPPSRILLTGRAMTSCDLTPASLAATCDSIERRWAWQPGGFSCTLRPMLVCVYNSVRSCSALMWGELRHFFGWQAAGFLALAFVVGIARPAIAGGALVGYLIVSTFVLLAFSHDAVFVAKLALLLLWAACAVGGMRQHCWRVLPDRNTRRGASRPPPSTRRSSPSASSWALLMRSDHRSSLGWPF